MKGYQEHTSEYMNKGNIFKYRIQTNHLVWVKSRAKSRP